MYRAPEISPFAAACLRALRGGAPVAVAAVVAAEAAAVMLAASSHVVVAAVLAVSTNLQNLKWFGEDIHDKEGYFEVHPTSRGGSETATSTMPPAIPQATDRLASR